MNVKHRKKTAATGRTQKSEGLKKRRMPPSEDTKASTGKRIKPSEAASIATLTGKAMDTPLKMSLSHQPISQEKYSVIFC